MNRMRKSLVAALASLVVAAVALSGCTGTVAKGSTVRVAVSQPLFSSTAKTSFGNEAANTSIVAATNSQFNDYDNRPDL